MKPTLIIREIPYQSEEYDMELKLRDHVLRQPLGMSIYHDDLTKENEDLHLGAFVEKQLVGTLILTSIDPNTVRMRQVAVDPTWQHQQVGSQLVRFAESLAIQKGFTHMILHARKSAVPFYIKLGYQIVTDEFLEINLPHFGMHKLLNETLLPQPSTTMNPQ